MGRMKMKYLLVLESLACNDVLLALGCVKVNG